MNLREAWGEWAKQKRRRDQGKPFEREKVIAALRGMVAGLQRSSESDSQPPLLALTDSGFYDLETATEDDLVRLAEELYQQEGSSP